MTTPHVVNQSMSDQEVASGETSVEKMRKWLSPITCDSHLIWKRLLWVLSITFGPTYLAVVASVLAAAKILNDECTTKVRFRDQKRLLLSTYILVIIVLFFCSIFYIWEWSCRCRSSFRKFRSNMTLHSIVEIFGLTLFASITTIEIALTSDVVFDCTNDSLSLSNPSSNSSSALLGSIIGYASTRGLTVVLSCLFLTLTVLLKPISPSTCVKVVRSVGSIALILGNGVLWLEAFMISLSEKSLVFNAIETDDNCPQQENVTMCLNDRHDYNKKLRPILIPFFTEYSLAALLIGLHSFTTSSTDTGTDNEAVSNDREFESETIITSNQLDQEDKVNCRDFAWIFFSVILVIFPLTLIGVVLLFENEVQYSDNLFTKESEHDLHIASILTLTLDFAGLFVSITILFLTCYYKTVPRQVIEWTWKEIVLFLSLLSLQFSWPLQVDFDVSCKQATSSDRLSCRYNFNSTSVFGTDIVYAVIPPIEAACQFYLLFYLKRIYLPKTKWIKMCLLVLVTINLELWAIDTFYWSEKNVFLQQASKGSTEKEWHFYTTVLLSTTIFFRYECAITFVFVLAETLKQQTILSCLQKGQYLYTSTSELYLQRKHCETTESSNADAIPTEDNKEVTVTLFCAGETTKCPFKLHQQATIKDLISAIFKSKDISSSTVIITNSEGKALLENSVFSNNASLFCCLGLPYYFEVHDEQGGSIPVAPILDELEKLKQYLKLKENESFWPLSRDILQRSWKEEKIALMRIIPKELVLIRVTLPSKKLLPVLLLSDLKTKDFYNHLQRVILKQDFVVTTKIINFEVDFLLWNTIDGICRMQKRHKRERQFLKYLDFQIQCASIKRKTSEKTFTFFLKEVTARMGEEREGTAIKEEAESDKATAISLCKIIAPIVDDFPLFVISYEDRHFIVSGETEIPFGLITRRTNYTERDPKGFFVVWKNKLNWQKEFTVRAKVHREGQQSEETDLRFSEVCLDTKSCPPTVGMSYTSLSVAAALLDCHPRSCYWSRKSLQRFRKKELIVHKDKIIFFHKDQPFSVSKDANLKEIIINITGRQITDGEARSYCLELGRKKKIKYQNNNLTDERLTVEKAANKFDDEDIYVEFKVKKRSFKVKKVNDSSKPVKFKYALDKQGQEFRTECISRVKETEGKIQSIKYKGKDIHEGIWLADLLENEPDDASIDVKVELKPENNDQGRQHSRRPKKSPTQK